MADVKILLSAGAATLLLLLVSGASGASVPAGDWLGFGRTTDNMRHSPLTEITRANADQLGRAYTIDLKNLDADTRRGEQSYPLAINGTLYVTTNDAQVFALNGSTGKMIWHYKPSNSGLFKNFGIVANRGLAYCDGALFLLTLDMHLNKLNPSNGALLGRVAIGASVPGAGSNYGYSETSAPICANHKVIAGAAGSEYGIRGYVMAWTPTAPGVAEPCVDDPAGAAELARRQPYRRRRRRLDAGYRRHVDEHRVLRDRLGHATLFPVDPARDEPAYRLAVAVDLNDGQAQVVASADRGEPVVIRRRAAAARL